ncbi:EAP30/Vps36 family protein [Wolffia australiana]
MESWLPAASLTSSGRPTLIHGEIERALVRKVDLEVEEKPDLAPLRSGLLSLTTHRLIWVDGSSIYGCYLPLDSIIEAYPAKKSIRSMFHSQRIIVLVKASAAGRIGEAGPRTETIIIVLRDKNESDSFYGRLMEVLRSRSWEIVPKRGDKDLGDGRGGGNSNSLGTTNRVVGVSGIIRKEQEKWESTDKSLQEAFQDLNALMRKAKEMVELAGRMRSTLLMGANTQANPVNDDEFGSKQEIQDWFLSVGIVSPVTKETAGALYHQELSRQLADFVQLPLKKSGGMIALIDVYCLFNRARGTELISPEDLLQACRLWEKIDVPVMLRKFDSDVMVIQDKFHSDKEVFERIKSLALSADALRRGLSPSDAAMTLGVAPALANEYLLAAENEGLLCRDVSPEGFRFYVNLFREIDPSCMFTTEGQGLMKIWASAVN